MKTRGLAWSSAFALACAAGYGCGSTVEGTGSTGSGGSTSGDTQGSTGVVASASGAGGGVTTGGTSSGVGGSVPGCVPKSGAVLAVTKFFYGDTNFDGTANKVNGWKQYGFNVDGKVSIGTSTDLCKPLDNASPKSVYPDGDNGIDNSFGRNLLPLFLGISSDFTSKANQSISDGDYTLIVDLEGLGATANLASLVSKIYAGSPLGAPPKLDGKDCWPVAAEGLTNPADLTSAKSVFPMSSVVMNLWDSGPTGATIPIQISFSGVKMHLDIHHARMTMDLAPDHQSAMMGRLGGVVETAQLVAEVKRMAGSFDASLCKGPTIDSILAQVRQASDILKDGAQDPAKECDAVSIGLGFQARGMSFSGAAVPPPTEPNPCPP